MQAIRFASIRPQDIQRGAILVEQDQEWNFPRKLYVVTSHPGQPRAVVGLVRPIVTFLPMRGEARKITTTNKDTKEEKTIVQFRSCLTFPLDTSWEVPFEADLYLEQKDGSFLKVKSVNTPFVFPKIRHRRRPSQTTGETGHVESLVIETMDVLTTVYQEGDRLWLEA